MATSSFTRNLEILTTDLGDKVQQLHSKEEYDLLKSRLQKAIGSDDIYGNKKNYGADVQQVYTSIVNLFATVCLEFNSNEFPLRITRDNEKNIWKSFKSYSSKLVSQEEVDNRFIEELYKIHSEYKSSKDYIRRLVLRRLKKISPEFVCVPDAGTSGGISEESELRADIDSISTRLLILKQFIKKFGWCESVKGDDDHGRGFECPRLKALIGDQSFQTFAEGIREDIFDKLEERKINGALSREENNLRMVNIAKYLGEGHFQRNSNNREPLYVFAIAFEMTLSFSSRIPGPDDGDYETDIRKNLFFDFYTDNLVNLLTQTGVEADISGYGINYKNFGEVAYLRSIKFSGTALEKLREARTVISRCEKDRRAKSLEEFENMEDDIGDKVSYGGSDVFLNDFIQHLDDDTDIFCDYLLGNYVCKDIERPYRYGFDLRTATDTYIAFTSDDIRRDRRSNAILDAGVWEKGIKVQRNDTLEEKHKKKFFNAMLSHYSDLLKREKHLLEYSSSELRDQVLIEGKTNDYSAFLDDAKKFYEIKDEHDRLKVIRSDLVIAAMDYIIVSFYQDNNFIPNDELMNFGRFYYYIANYSENLFGDVLDDKKSLNEILIDCGFMEISAKSVFDLIAIYSAYQRLTSLLHVYEVEGRS